jgi:hypothetical protein
MACGVAALFFGGVSTSTAEDAVPCQLCYNDNVGGVGGPAGPSQYGWHNFTAGTCLTASENCRDCRAFNACHTKPQSGQNCTTLHWGCGQTQAARDVLDASSLASLDQLKAETAIHSSELALTEDGYLVHLDCKGRVSEARAV